MTERSVQYRLSEDDFIAAALAHHRAALSSWKRRLIIFLVLAAIVLIQMWREGGLGDMLQLVTNLLIVAALAVAVEWLMQRWILPARIRRHYRQTRHADEQVELRWDDEAVHFRSERGDSRTPMTDWFAWVWTADMLLLYENDLFYCAIPAKPLGEGRLDELTALLAAAGVPEKGSRQQRAR